MKKIIFITLFIFSFILSLLLNIDKIKVPYFNGIYKDVAVDIIFKDNQPKVFFDDNQITTALKIDNNHFQFKKINQSKISDIKIEGQNLEKIMVFVGNDVKFIDKNQTMIKINNSKNILDTLAIIFLSFFYNFELYLFSYLFLFLYLVNFKVRLNYRKTFFIVLFLCIFLRLAQINYIPFWDDEMYVLAHCASYSKLINLFNDPGNPPLYFIYFKIYKTIFSNLEFYRYSSLILGILFNLAIFNYIKQRLNKKAALLGFFISSISIVLIYFSQEIRCYMMLMLFSVILNLYLFKFNNKKNKIIYFLTTLGILYTHFYGAFLVLYNFIFGLTVLKKHKKSFVLINLISFLFYLPLIIYKSSSLTSDFNSWIKKPTILDIIQTTDIFAKPVILFIFFMGLAIFFILKAQKTKEKIFLRYNFLGILFVIFASLIFSILIKPIFLYRYFYVVFPCYIALISYFITYRYSFKLKIIFQTFLFLIFTTTSQINYQNLFCNHNLYLEFIKNDIDLSKNNYIFLSDTIKDYKEIKDEFKNVNLIYLPMNKGINTLDLRGYHLKKENVIYVLNLYLHDEIYKNAKKIELFKTSLGIFCKIINEK